MTSHGAPSGSPAPSAGSGRTVWGTTKSIVRTGADIVGGAIHSRDGAWADIRHFWSHDFPHRIEHGRDALRGTLSGIPGASGTTNPLIAALSSAHIIAGRPVTDFDPIFDTAVTDYPWHVFGDQENTRRQEAEAHLQNIRTGHYTAANIGTLNAFLRMLQGALQTHSRVTTDPVLIRALRHARHELTDDINTLLRDNIWHGTPPWANGVNPTPQAVRTQAQEAFDLLTNGIDLTTPGTAIVYRPDPLLRALDAFYTSLHQATGSMPQNRADLPNNAQNVPWHNPEYDQHGAVARMIGYSAESQRQLTRRLFLGGAASGLGYLGLGGSTDIFTEEKPTESKHVHKGSSAEYVKSGKDYYIVVKIPSGKTLGSDIKIFKREVGATEKVDISKVLVESKELGGYAVKIPAPADPKHKPAPVEICIRTHEEMDRENAENKPLGSTQIWKKLEPPK